MNDPNEYPPPRAEMPPPDKPPPAATVTDHMAEAMSCLDRAQFSITRENAALVNVLSAVAHALLANAAIHANVGSAALRLELFTRGFDLAVTAPEADDPEQDRLARRQREWMDALDAFVGGETP